MSVGDLNDLDDNEFRQRWRDYLAATYPAAWRQDARRPFLRVHGDDAVWWFRKLNADGWRAPSWPRAFGGIGLSFKKQLIYREEMERARVARFLDHGEAVLGPVLMQFGTPEQQRCWLPRALDCQDMWCQGYSEPNAGSDLANLQTSAVLEEDYFVVNGQKTWTTHAEDATHIFLLVRTDRQSKKQAGISFILADLNTPGITIRPIVNMAGEDEFCEVFFDDVRIPRSNLVGEINQGWTVAKALLGHERIFLGSPALAANAFDMAMQIAREMQLLDNAAVRDALAELGIALSAMRSLYEQACDAAAAGHSLGPEVSILKIAASELTQKISEYAYKISSDFGGVVGDVQIGGFIADLHWQFMLSRPMTVYGGSSEIQRNILAKAVLQLPTER
jgi:alkylation response protein AidB-like acyl-CoA dehydrogenase